jgi:hypothetical protein
MATVSDTTTTPLSGLNHIDALLDKGSDWNYLSNSNANVLYYTFSCSIALLTQGNALLAGADRRDRPGTDLIDFAESPENQAQVIDVVGKGLDFVPWQG